MYFKQIVFILIVSSSLSGGTTGKLTGVVKDEESGNSLIGCNIIISGTLLGASSNEKGDYYILNIPPGKYNIRYEMMGYKKLIQESVSISIDKTTRLNVALKSSVIEGEEVTVLAERKLIQFDVTQSEAIITSEELEGMPVTEVSEVLRLQGGMTQDADGGLHMRGGRTSEVSYMVDGVPMSDTYDGGISVQIEKDNMQ